MLSQVRNIFTPTRTQPFWLESKHPELEGFEGINWHVRSPQIKKVVFFQVQVAAVCMKRTIQAQLIKIEMLSAQCSVLSAQCSVLSAQCSVLSTQCSVFSAQFSHRFSQTFNFQILQHKSVPTCARSVSWSRRWVSDKLIYLNHSEWCFYISS